MRGAAKSIAWFRLSQLSAFAFFQNFCDNFQFAYSRREALENGEISRSTDHLLACVQCYDIQPD
jgi:hypothetical protein